MFRLKLIRYVHGLKFEQLQQAIASSAAPTPTTNPASFGYDTNLRKIHVCLKEKSFSLLDFPQFSIQFSI